MKYSQNRLVVVLGMHRSGTSAITRSLGLLGVGLGSNLHPAGFDNPKGFWEDRGVLDLNEELLALQDSAYDRLGLAQQTIPTGPEIGRLKLKAVQLVQERLASAAGLWGFKDPRTCRLLSFWLEIFAAIGCRVSFVIALRNPASVAASLNNRNQTPAEKSYWLWLQHMLPAVLQSHGMERVVVDYDAFMDAPYVQLARIARAIDLPLPASETAEVRDFVNEFLEAGLRHTRFSLQQLKLDSRVPAAVCELYGLLSAVARDEATLEGEAEQSQLATLDRGLNGTAALVSYANALEDERMRLWQNVFERDGQIAGLSQAVSERDGQIADLSQAVTERDGQIAGLSQAVSERDGQIADLSQAVTERDGQIAGLSQAVSERDGQIADLSQAVTERDGQIAGLSQAVSERDGQIADLSQAVTERDGQIAGLSQAVSERDGQIADLSQAVTERDGQLDRLSQAVSERDGQIADLSQAVTERDGQISHLNQAVADAKRELAQVLASNSWKITKPIRFGRRMAISKPYAAARRALSDNSRALWRALPLPYERKRLLKDSLFKTFPSFFHWTKAYQAWCAFNAPFSNTSPVNPVAKQHKESQDEFVPLLQAAPLDQKPVRLICFYLPQFHAIPENNAWWGEGFTEWTNVQPAEPQFEGHYQPHVPGELGYYNLLDPAVQRRQVELAKLYGIEGFCFYFYWFGGKRLLEAPVEKYLNDSSLDLPFCLCWANENWSRRWDGLDSEILIAQQHSPEDDLAFIEYVAKYLRDPRYIRIDGKPLLLVYRPSLLPRAKETAARWRDWCRKNGVGEIYLVYTQSFDVVNPAQYGFDAATEFPPNNSAPPNITDSVTPKSDQFACTVYDGSVFVERSEYYKQVNYKLFRGVCTSWDNTARRKNRGTVFLGNTPAHYQRWLENAISDTVDHRENKDERLVFVNAWNEWAEGAHLEPDARYGYAWLQATRNAMTARGALAQRSILVVTHDCHPHGAQFLALEMIRQLIRMGYKPVIVALDGGKLLDEFRALGPLLVGSAVSESELLAFLTIWRNRGCVDALTSTVVCGSILPTLKNQGFRVISLIHELSGVIRSMKQEANARHVAELADKVVFPATMVRDQFEAVAQVDAGKVVIRPQGLLRKNPYRGRNREAQRMVCARHGLPPDTQIVLNIGYLDERKAPDLFVEIAAQVCNRNARAVFIWVGHAESAMEQMVRARIEQLGLQDKVLLAGFNAEPFEYYAAASAYALTSREDPFPNVVLESVAVGVPVVAFEGTTGAADFIQLQGGRLARHLEPDDFADHLVELLGRPTAVAADIDLSLQRYLLDLLHTLNGTLRVSVIVPNYNYAQLIEQRLDSIYAQIYPIYEIIVLDDASTDDSVRCIERAVSNRSVDARLQVNECNSGSVFRQWDKGVRLASGDLVWIAEADDIAAPEFISTLIPAFLNEEVVMAFCQSRQIDGNGNVLSNDYLGYTADISDRWKSDHFADGLREIRESLAIKNVIPNVSGVLFDRMALLNALGAAGEALFDYRVAGDWLVYLHVLTQGRLYYSAKSLNDHRRHQSSVTSAAGLEKHLMEVASVQAVAQSLSKPDSRIAAQARDYLACLRTQFNLDSNPAAGHEHEKIDAA